jgi:hypothetical protein
VLAPSILSKNLLSAEIAHESSQQGRVRGWSKEMHIHFKKTHKRKAKCRSESRLKNSECLQLNDCVHRSSEFDKVASVKLN